MRKTLLQMYHDLKEAGSVDDFPNLLADVAHKKLLAAFRSVVSPWDRYAQLTDVSDFKTHNRIILGEAPDLLPVTEGGPYQGGNYPTDKKYQITAETFGRQYCLTRKAIINDDLNGFLTWSEKYGRAANRSIGKKAVLLLENGASTYDAKALFHADHANTVAGDLTADDAGVTKLDSAWAKFMNMTEPDSAQKIGVKPWALVCAPAKAVTCERLVQMGELRPVSTSGGPVYNPFAGKFPGGVIVEPLLTLTNRVYMIANPAEMPFLEIAFLNGKREPDLLLKNPDTVRIAGGSDPWGFDFDDMYWKVRHDWGTQLAYYQGIVGIGGGLT